MKKLLLLSLGFLFFSSSAVFGQIKIDPKHLTNKKPILNEPFVQPQEFFNFSFTDDYLFNSVPRSGSREIDSGLAQQLQSVLDEYVVNYQIKGLSGALMAPNGDIWAGASGISHDTVDLTTDMLLGIASNTKNFIATIIMQLYEADSLLLSDSLYKFVPSYENIDSTVTVEQLLNHTSGIYNYLSNPALGDSLNESTTRTWTVEELLDYFVLEPSFSPGANWEYSNTNYLLLGMIIEEVTGNEVVDEIRNRLSIPFGLSSTYLFPDEGYEGFRSHVWTMISGTLVDVTDFADTALFSAAWTAGAMLSTATDMVKWSKGLNEGGLLQDSTLELMTIYW